MPTIDWPYLNPYGLAEGAPCDHIRITYLGPQGAAQAWDGVVSLPPEVGGDWEGAATAAFLEAKQHGLQAGMMAFCSFSYYDDDVEGWVHFL
jgi:hypothetical protein